MRSCVPALFASLILGSLSGCLSPLTSDAVDPTMFFGDPNADPATLHIQDDPKFLARTKMFGKSVAYLTGFADHEAIHYWNVDGPNATFIAPLFEITGRDGKIIGQPIIDVIPGDTGYTPWWRREIVHTTDKYNGQRIWSREA